MPDSNYHSHALTRCCMLPADKNSKLWATQVTALRFVLCIDNHNTLTCRFCTGAPQSPSLCRDVCTYHHRSNAARQYRGKAIFVIADPEDNSFTKGNTWLPPPPHPIPFTHSLTHSLTCYQMYIICNTYHRADTAPIVFL